MESMTQTCPESNHEAWEPALNDLKAYVQRAARQGIAAHEAEAGIWQRVLQLGHQALGLLFHLVGPGDVGETIVLPDGQEVPRLETPHPRVYQSVFGRFQLERVVYGTREGEQGDAGDNGYPPVKWLDVRFISSSPVEQQSGYTVWGDRKLVQMVWAEG